MPSFDPYDEKDFARLRKVLKRNYEDMKPFRDVRELNVEAARGHYYKTEDDPPNLNRDPVNMMDQYVQILVRSFVQSVPKVRVTNRNEPRFAKIYEEHLNQTANEMGMLDTMRQMVAESLLGYVGIVYITIAPTELDPAGETFGDPINLPNFVADMSKTQFDDCDIMGHRFTRRKQDMAESGMYNPEQLALVTSKHKGGSSQMDDKNKNRRFHENALFDEVDVWAVLIKPLNMIVYMADHDGPTAPLRVESYDGPEFGPYVLLGYDKVLDELLPNSRGAMALDLHEFVNGQYRRIFIKEDQAAEFIGYEGGSEEDGRRFRDAMDSELVRFDNLGSVQRMSKGGTNPQALGTAIHGRQLFDELTGFIRRAGGVSSTADTATEAKLDSANTSRMIRDMQLQVIAAAELIYKNIAWHLWTHPTRTRNVRIKVGENGQAVDDMWTPEEREGDFIEYEFQIVPDSMEHRSSRQQLSELMQAVQGVVIPLMQMPTDRPVILKVPELVQKYSELANLPELAEVAEYALDEAFVSNPQTSGSALRIPAGATSEGRLNGGVRSQQGSGESVENALLSSALSQGQQGQQQEGQV